MYATKEQIQEHYQRATDKLINYAAKCGQYATPLIQYWSQYIDKGYTDQDAMKFAHAEIDKWMNRKELSDKLRH